MMKCETKFFGSVTVGDRGQLVIPSDARESLDIASSDKLLVFKAPFGDGLLVVKPDAFEKHLDSMNQRANDLRDRVLKESEKQHDK